ncbi:MAG: nucleoid-associated protein [Akkermansiaceae bacterium]|nr:nucleoid-associated protein [Akkermansiaceae bacterium]MCP5543196.1 nucleoid-associated protein [Akkermansiaceae bacterium]MCP5546322.1 nucleoid-associated protein [Akkermansiaceae bacterium]
MTLKLDFSAARITGLVLAKVGNPSRDEPLQTSKQVFHVDDADQPTLSAIFTRPFRSLPGQRFHHHTALEKHEVNSCAAAIFGSDDALLSSGIEIAERLYAKSSHPNIKSGDLCISLVEGIDADGETKRAICILKSESVTPFLSISTRDGDLQLATEHGINPEKIDKGCLILDHFPHKGYYVLTFDRAGSESRFWVRDFLSVQPISDAALLSKRVAEMAVAAVTSTVPETSDAASDDEDSPPWNSNLAAREALSYFDGKKTFSMQEFEEQALRTPEARRAFAEERKRIEEEEGVKLDDSFDISKRDVTKAKKLMKSVMRLDTGVEIRLKPKVVDKPDSVLEKGYDESRGMKYIKVYFHKDLA